jgi:hypothetical protein
VVAGGDVAAAEVEGVVEPVVGGGEALRPPRRLEALHLPAMPDAWHQLARRRAVARELVGRHDARRTALPLQKLAQDALRGLLVAPALHRHVEHHVFDLFRRRVILAA